ncbi:hypothetical protein BY996DRAFT_6411157, partial [Phakopsora pachyrhizi]
FISKVDPNIQLPNRVRLEELRDTARAIINTRGSSIEPSIQIPNKIRLQELREMALNLIEPPRGRSPKRKFDPDDPALRISDLKDFISKVDPNIQLPNRVRLEELRDTARAIINTRGSSRNSQQNKASRTSRMALNLIEPPRGRSPKRRFISKVDPNIQLPNRVRLEELRDTARAIINTRGRYSQRNQDLPHLLRGASRTLIRILPGVQKADLREVMLQIDPSCHIPSNIRLAELRDMTYSMIHPYASLPHSQRGSFGTNRNRSASPARSGLRSRSASPPSRSIKEFDPYSSGVHKADLREVMLQIDPSCHTSNIRLAELRDMTYSMIHPYASLPHSQRGSFGTNRNHKLVFLEIDPPHLLDLALSRSASPPSRSIKEFDPYSSGVHKADLREVMLQIDPSCHIPSNIRLAELRDMTYSMIHPYASLPHSQEGLLKPIVIIDPSCHIPSNIRLAELRDMTYSMIHPYASLPHSQRGSFETSRNRAASPARPGLRSRPVTPPSQSIKDFDPYSPNVHMADLREVVFQINPNCHIPCDIRLAELRNMVYSMIHPHPRLHKKVQPQSKILQKRKASSQNEEQNFKEAINSDSSSDTPTYYCKRKRYLNGVFIPHDVEFMTEVDGLEYGSTPSDESSSKSFTHEKPKCNQKGSSKSASQNSSGPSISDPSGSPSKTLSGLTGSCPAPSSTGKFPSLPLDFVMSQRPPAPPRPLKPPALRQTPLEQPSKASTSRCFQVVVDGNAPGALEYGSTPTDESLSKSFPHDNPKSNQKDSSNTKQPDGLKSASKSPTDLIDLTGAKWDSSGPSISDPSGNPSKTLSGLTGSCPAPSSTGKVPSLPLDFVMSQRPPAPPRPLKPPALRRTPLRQPSKALTSRCFQAVVDGNAPGALEYGSTPSDESSSKSFTHEKPKCNQKGLSKSASQNSSGPSISDPSGNPSKTLSGLTGSCPALSSTGKVPSLPLDFVMSQRPPAPPRPLKPPALCQTPLRQPSEASATESLQPFNESCKTNSANAIIQQGATLIETSSLPNHQPPTVIRIKATSSKFSSATPEKMVSNKNNHLLFENQTLHLKSQNYKRQIASLPRNENLPYASLDSISIALGKPVSFGNLTNQGRQTKSSYVTSENADSNNDSSNVSVWPSFETQQAKVDYEFTDPPHMIGEAVSSSMKASVPLKEIRALHSSHIIPSIISSPNPWVLVKNQNKQIKVRVNPAEFEENTSGQKTQTISLINNPWVDVAVSNSKQNLGKALQLTKSEFHEANQSASEPSNKKTSPAQKNRRHSSHNYMAFTTSSGTSMNNPVSPRVSPAKPILMRPQPIEQNKFQESSPKQQAESTSCQLEQTPLYSRSAEEVDNPSKSSTSKDILNTNSSLNFNASQPIARKTSIASHPLAVIESLERCKLELKKHPKTIGGGGKN